MPQRIKLLLAIPHLGGGGAERVTWLLARYLNPERFDIHLAVITEDLPGTQPLPSHVTIHRLNAPRVRSGGLLLYRLIRKLRPDVVLSNMAHLNFLLLLLKPFLPRQTTLLIRQNGTASKAVRNRAERLLYRYLYPRADAVLCQSQSMADDLESSFGISPGKLIVLHNPVEDPTLSHNSNITATLLAVGRLSPEKGFDLLIAAFAILLPCSPDLQLIILGDGPEAAPLRVQAETLGIEHSVHFKGHTDPAPYYAVAKLFVLSSRHEGMPNALLEAAANRLPLVATPCSAGVTSLIGDQPGAWISAEITAESLAAALHQAISALEHRPARFDHEFLTSFRLTNAVAAYENEIIRHARARGIAFMIPTIDQIGGAEKQVILLAGGLAARGWAVALVALSGNGTLQKASLENAGVSYLTLGMRKAWIDPRGWLRYLLWIRRHRPVIVHSHLPHATWFARCVRLLAPVRVLIDTIHTSRAGSKGRQRTYRLTGSLSDHVTCVSHAVSRAAIERGITPASKTSVVPNGISITEQQPRSRQDGGTFRWIAIGRLEAVKDYPTLLRAFALLPAATSLAILGTGAKEEALRNLAGELGIAQCVEFAGFQSDVHSWLAKADAFVLSSLWEGLPVSVLEAASHGLPIVATDGQGTREAIPPGGRLVPVGDHFALAAAMEQTMRFSPDERHALAAEARLFVTENFAMPAVLDRWEALYNRLLSSNPRASRTG